MSTLLPLLFALFVGTDDPTSRPVRAPDRELEGGVVVELLTAEEARDAIVDETDPFFEKLTLLEISLRLDEDVTELTREEAVVRFRAFLQNEVTDWPTDDRDTLLTALPRIAEACRGACPEIVPQRWRFIRTTGREESGAPYTRGDCIILPAGTIEQFAGQSLETLGKLVVHETVHVFTRKHPKERDALYAALGFHPIPAVTLPPAVDRLRLTNPDGPGWEHAIRVIDKDTGKQVRAILLLTSRTPKFQKAIRGVLPVLQFHLYPLTEDETPTLRLREDGEPVRWMPFTTPGFLDTIGRNTGYIIHPDEVLADNVSLLAYPPPSVESPQILIALAKLLGGVVNEPTSRPQQPEESGRGD